MCDNYQIKIFNKKGDSVWISAVIYFGVGIIIISILLAAGTPVINKIRDKNIIIQTKQIMTDLDYNIRESVREGPGTQRVLSLDLKQGEFNIDTNNELIYWKYDSNALLGEPCDADHETITDLLTNCKDNIIQEGTLSQVITPSGADKPYRIYLILDYVENRDNDNKVLVNLKFSEGMVPTLVGLTKLSMNNIGAECLEDCLEQTDGTCSSDITFLCGIPFSNKDKKQVTIKFAEV